MKEENLTAVRWIAHISAFLLGAWYFWSPNDVVMSLVAAGITSFLGGLLIRMPIELAFNSDDETNNSPFKKVLIFFLVIAGIALFIWAHSSGDYNSYLYN